VIEGLAWLIASVGAFGAVAWIVPRSVMATVTAYQRRHREEATPGTPSAVCGQCGGAWGKWSALVTSQHPNNPTYPNLYGSYEIRSQTRVCTECGYGERRVLA